ncbi:MAG: hypothetical protein ACRDD7_00615 [Peptostreptococcaceae bacterium]
MKINKIIVIVFVLFIMFTSISLNTTKIEKNKSIVETLNIKNKDINEKEAVEQVKKYLSQGGSYLPPIIEVDSIDGNYYIVHAYEIIKNDEESHTATTGWFYVNKLTGEVTDMMK